MSGVRARESVRQRRASIALRRSLLSITFGISIVLSFLGVRCRLSAAQVSNDVAAREKEECTKNLKLIYDATQAYQQEHKDLPNWLSDLVPDYLQDANV